MSHSSRLNARGTPFFTSRGAPLLFIAAGTPPPPLLLGACAPRNGSRLSRADALVSFLNARGAPRPLTSLAHSHSLEPRALRSGVVPPTSPAEPAHQSPDVRHGPAQWTTTPPAKLRRSVVTRIGRPSAMATRAGAARASGAGA